MTDYLEIIAACGLNIGCYTKLNEYGMLRFMKFL